MRDGVIRMVGAAALVATVLGSVGAGPFVEPRVARVTAADWKTEFEEVCSKTQDAMALSVEELRSLVSRADALASDIEKLDEAQRKVYGRRLKTCRDLYQYVLEYKLGETKT